MKLFGAIMVMLIIQTGILIMDGLIIDSTNSPQDNLLNPYNVTDSNINGTGGFTVWTFVTNPTEWSTSGLIGVLTTILVVAGAVGIGLYLWAGSDIALLFGFFIFLLGIGAVPVASLYTFVTREVTRYGCEIGTSCAVSQLVGMFTAGLLGLFWLFSVLSWWTNRDN